MDETYSYGHPVMPKMTDPRFDTLEQATEAAIQHQIECPWDNWLAIWRDEDGYIECLIFEGIEYRP